MRLIERLRIFFFTFLFYFLICLIFVFLFLPIFILAIIPVKLRPKSLFFYLLDKFYKSIIKITFVPVNIIDKENLPEFQAIFVVNHQSSLDAPILGSLLNGKPHLWFIYKKYAKIPFFRFFTDAIGVSVDQEGGEKDARALIEGINRIRQESLSVLLFPEGGRFNDGRVHDFYSGFSFLAKKIGKPVVPVFLENTGKVYPPESCFIYRYPIKVTIGRQIFWKDSDTIESFAKKVRSWLLDRSCF